VKAQFDYSSPHKVLNHKDIRVEFTGKNLTKFGGIQLLRKFLRHLKVKEELENAVQIKKRERKFQVGGMLLSLLYAITLDLKRQNERFEREFLLTRAIVLDTMRIKKVYA